MTKADSQKAHAGRVARLPEEVQIAARAAYDKKAQHVTVLDLRKGGAFTDYFLICTGTSTRQVKAIVEGVEDALKKAGVRPSHTEGTGGSEWVLLDYFDLIVHVFTPDTREFYALERLWGSAERLELTDADF